MNNPRAMAARPSVEIIARALAELSVEDLQDVVARRLWRDPDERLPALQPYEDPADILVAAAEQNAPARAALQPACVSLVGEWAREDASRLRRNPEPLGELVFLCAMIGAAGASPAIRDLAGRDELAAVLLPGGEDLQNRSLRALSGLLRFVSPDERGRSRGLFVRSLDTRSHAAIALTTLAIYWPEETLSFLERARMHNDPRLEQTIRRLDTFVAAARAHEDGR